MKKAATTLQQAGVPFALAGGGAAYARGAAPPVHDVDFVIVEADAGAAAQALAATGMTVQRPPEGWLIKAFDADQMLDLIFCLGGVPVTGDLLDRAEELDVDATRMPVLDATDLVLSWLRSFSEHHADFAGTLSLVRPIREQVDWDLVRRETGQSPFARAFLVLLEGLGVLAVPTAPRNGAARPDEVAAYHAGRIERALAGDPRTHELGVRVDVERGTVYLRGEVAGDHRRELVADVARDAAPELSVRNEVAVTRVRPAADGTPLTEAPGGQEPGA
jgi:hypothetical protein